MAKFKPAGSKKPGSSAKAKGAIPCVIIIVVAIGIVCLLFYVTLSSSPTP